MTAFDFDVEIDRRQMPALKGHPMVLGRDGQTCFPAASPTWISARRRRCCGGLSDRLAPGPRSNENGPEILKETGERSD